MAKSISMKSSVRGVIKAAGVLLGMLLFSTCDVFNVGLGNKVDIRPPEIAITSPANNAYVKGNLTVTGTVADDLRLDSVNVVVDATSYPATVTGSSWTVTLPAGQGAAGVSDGKKTITAVARDAAGKDRSAEILINVDNTPPFVLLTVPQGYGSAAGTYTGYIDFKGEVWDPSPVSKVEVVVIDSTTKSEIKRKEAQGTNTWSVRFNIGPGEDLPFDSAQSGNRYEYYVEATDAAGNQNIYAFHSQDIYALMTTYSISRFPVTSELGAMDQNKRDSILGDLNGLTYVDLFARRINLAPYDATVSDFKYDSDGTKPVITFTNIDPSNPVEANVVGSKTPILGSVSPGPAGTAVDGNSIQATLYPLSPAGASFAITPTLNPIGSTVNFQFALKQGPAYLSNGRYRITVTAQASGGSIAVPVSVDFLIDNNVPQYVRLTPADEAFASRIDLGGGKGMGVRLNVIVNDDNDTTDGIAHSSLTSAVASATDGGAALPGVTITDGGDVIEASTRIGRLWIVDVPYAAGTELYLEYTAQDSGGSVATRSHHIAIDETPPTVSLNSIAAEPDPIGVRIGADSAIFSGTSEDSQSNVAEIRWWIGVRDGSDLPASTSAWNLATGTTVWKSTSDFTSVEEGRKRLFVRAKDSAGNWSTPVTTMDLTFDKANPIATMSVAASVMGYTEADVEYREGAFTLSGDCDDETATIGRRASLVELYVIKDGGAATPLALTSGGPTDGAWTYNQTANAVTHAQDGLYVYTLTVTDEAGRVNQATRKVRIDTTPPEVEIKEPAPSEATLSSTYSFIGTARDEGSDVDAPTLRYQLNGSVPAVLPLIGARWEAEDVVLGSEGTKTLVISCADKLGNAAAPVSVVFFYDLNKPTLSESAIGTTDTQFAKANLVFGGSVSDTNGLASLKVSVDGAVATSTGITVDLDGPDNVLGTSDDGGVWSYTQDVDTDGLASGDTMGLAEGLHSLEFIVTDVAGKTSATPVLRSVRVDTTAPTADVDGVSGYVSGSISITGTAGDPGGSGVSGVQYQLGGTGGTWIDASGTSTWLGNLDLSAAAEAAQTLYVRSVDRAGNISANATTTINVDRANPRATMSGPGTLVQSKDDVAFTGIADDAAITPLRAAASAIISWSKDGGTPTDVVLAPDADGPDNVAGNGDDGYWAWTLSKTLGDGLYSIELKVVDIANKSSPTVIRMVQIDTTAPTLAVAAPVNNESTDSSTYAISGTSRDTGGAGFDGTSDVEYCLDVYGSWTSLALAGTSWSKAGISLGAIEGAHQFWFRSTDKLGNAAEVGPVTMFYDLAPPVLTEAAVATTDRQYRNANLGFGGLASDSNALASLVVSVDGGPPSAIAVDGGGSWSYDAEVDTDGAGPDTGLAEGAHTLVFTAKDIAEKTTSLTRFIEVDTTKPTLSGVTDLGIGWKKNSSNSVSGTASDANLLAVEYRVSADGVFDGSPALEMVWSSFTGTGSFSATIAMSDGAANKLQIRAMDKAGNVSTPAAGDRTEQTVMVDSANPEAALTSPLVTAKLSAAGSLPVSIAAVDTTSGVSEVRLKVASSDFSSGTILSASLDSGTAYNGSWIISLQGSDFGAVGEGARTVYYQLADAAGRTSSIGSLVVLIDRTAPVVTFGSHVDSAIVNKGIILSGAATEANGITSMALAIWKPNNPGLPTSDSDTDGIWETPVPAVAPAVAGTYSWSVDSLDTTAFDEGTWDARDTAGFQLRLRITSTDEAGNVGYLERKLTVDQDSDKPIVKLINLATTGTPYLKQAVINGSITDDDGTVASLRMKTAFGDAFQNVDLDGQSFAYTVTGLDGGKDLYFEITDAKGTVFTTAAAASDTTPRLYQAPSTYLQTPLYFKFDTAIPTIADTITVDRLAPLDFAADANTVPLVTGMAFGGNSRDFRIRVEATDANGIKSVSVALPGTGTFAASPLSGDYFSTGTIGVGSSANGSVTITVTVTDNADLITTTSRSVVIDNAKPTLTIISPANAAMKNGAVQVSFSAADAGSSLSSLSYRLGRNYGSTSAVDLAYPGISTLDIDGASVDGASGYAYTSGSSTLYLYPIVVRAVDGAGNELETAPITGTGATRGSTTTLVSSDLIGNDQIAVGQAILLGTGALPMSSGYVRLISAWDKATGSVTLDSAVATSETSFTIVPYSLRINPDADKPTAAFLYPLSGATLGGTIRVYGSAVDDDGVSEVYMQIDTDSDGSFDPGDDAIGGWYNGDSGRLVSGQSNWNQTINESLELNPAGDDPKVILLRVRVKDINGTFGAWTDPVSVSIDKNVPKLGSAYALKLDPDSDKDNGNETVYTSGMYLRGDWTLRGSVEDETALKSVIVSGEASVAASISWNGSAYVGDVSRFEFVTAEGGGAGSSSVRCKRIDLKIPVNSPTETSKTWNFTLTALDVSDPARESSQAMRLNIDTKAPVVAYTGSTTVRQSSGTYKYQGTATDEGSGLNRVEVYLVRRGNGTTTVDRFYRPKPNTLSSAVDRLDVVALSDVRDFSNGAGVIYPANSNYVLTIEDTKTPASDADGYDELLSEVGVNSYEWKMFINSLSVPDGPIEIHYVAFDQAGNSTHGYIPRTTAKVENNAPTVGAIWLGTDLNDDGTVDASAGSPERSKYVFGESEASKVTSFKVKNDPMRIDFEIADSNGDSAEDGNGILETQLFTGPDTASLVSRGAFVIRNGGAGTAMAPINLDATALAAIADGTRVFRFVIWDSTEETTRLTDSLSVTRDITCKVKLADSRSPVTVVSPLYWNSAVDNSLLGKSRANGHIEVNGVPGDAADPKVSGQISIRGTTTDDKRVSEIWMHIDGFAFPGSAYSYVGYPTPVSKTIGSGGTYYRVATYDLTSAPGAGDARENGYIVRDTYAANGWKFSVVSSAFTQNSHVVEWRLDWNSALVTGVAANDQTVSIVAEDKLASPNQSSQTASAATLSGTGVRSDSTHIQAAGLQNQSTLWDGLTITVGSTTTSVADYDAASGLVELESAVDLASTSYSIALPPNTPSDVYDVVPYITGIANPANQGLTSDVIRSSTGKYSIDYHATNTFTVNGFNLGAAAVNTPSARVSANVISVPSGLSPATTFVSVNSCTVSKSLTRSGYLTIFVNNIPSVNNLTTANADEYQKEKDPTKIYTEQWTDDRYLWVWNTTQVLPAVSNQTFYYPDMIMEGTQPIFSYANDNNGYTYRTTSDGASTAKAGRWYERQTAIAYADTSYWILSVEDAFSGTDIGFLQLNRDATAAAAVGAADTDFIEIAGEDYSSRQLNRFRYPKLLAETNGADADVYIAYYDAEASQKNINFVSMRATGANSTAAGFSQAGNDNTKASPMYTLPTAEAGAGFSQYYDMVKYGANSVAIVYYDEAMSMLRLAYTTSATTGNNVANTAAWTTLATPLDSDLYAGTHVSMTSDANNLYIAYYDSASANLKTIRVAHATMTASSPVVVDAYLSVGTWTNIQMMDFDGAGAVYSSVPVITYYADSFNGTKKPIKMAFPTTAANETVHGVLSATSEAFSGAWEVMTVPAASAPKGGMEQFNHTQLGSYANNGMTLPVVGWLADRIEYSKLQPNN